LQEIFENSLLNLSIENSKQISNNHPHNRANNLHTHHCRDMEALVIMGFRHWLLRAIGKLQTDSRELERIKFLGKLQTLSMKDGDTVVLMTEGSISQETAERMKEYWANLFSAKFPNSKCIVLSSDMTIGILAHDGKAEGGIGE
jgi:hypothetical protein